MVSLSAPLVDENSDDYRALRADPVGAALWPFIAAAHIRVLTLQRLGPTPERLQEIMKLEAWYDVLHDDDIRGIWYLFIAVEFLHAQPDDRQRFQRLRERLLPDGLSSTQRSYRDQSGQAHLTSSRLDAADWELLHRMPLPGGITMADVVTRWFGHAAKLGELENERAGDSTLQQPTGAEILAARHGWIRAMRTLYDALALRDDLPESLQTILRRLDNVVERAAARHRGGQDNGTDGDIDGDIGGEPDGDIDIQAAAEQIMMTDEVIESPISKTLTGAAQGSDA